MGPPERVGATVGPLQPFERWTVICNSLTSHHFAGCRKLFAYKRHVNRSSRRFLKGRVLPSHI